LISLSTVICTRNGADVVHDTVLLRIFNNCTSRVLLSTKHPLFLEPQTGRDPVHCGLIIRQSLSIRNGSQIELDPRDPYPYQRCLGSAAAL
jgi:hypothetical protein